MLKLENCHAGYQNAPSIIKNISLSLPPGVLTSVIGPNGCGKSTLLRVLAGALKPSTGTLLVDDKPAQSFTPCCYAKHVAYLPQTRPIPAISVHTLVSHGRFPHLTFPRKLSATDHMIVNDALKKLNLYQYRDRLISELSGGERQKVYLAMLLAQDSNTLLLDEPTTYLDIHHQLEFLEILRNLTNNGKSICMVLHDLSHALLYSDQVLVMEKGTILCLDTPDDVYASGAISKAFGVHCTKLLHPNTHQSHYIVDIF